MLNRRPKFAVVLVLLTALFVSCGDDDSIRARTATPSTIGSLAIDDRLGQYPADDTPIADQRLLLACADVVQLANDLPWMLPSPSDSIGRPLCTTARPGGTPPGAFVIEILYVPQGLSPQESSFDDIGSHGGIVISTGWGYPDQTLPSEDAHLAHVDINGDSGFVARLESDYVVLTFWHMSDDGRLARVILSGDFTPDRLANLARSLKPGVPDDSQTTGTSPGATPTSSTTTTSTNSASSTTVQSTSTTSPSSETTGTTTTMR